MITPIRKAPDGGAARQLDRGILALSWGLENIDRAAADRPENGLSQTEEPVPAAAVVAETLPDSRPWRRAAENPEATAGQPIARQSRESRA